MIGMRALLAFLAVPLFLAGCGLPGALPVARNAGDLQGGGTILVGSVEIIPPLGPDEQVLARRHEKYRNSAVLLTGQKLQKVDIERRETFSNHILARLGETFFVKVPGAPLYFLGGVVYMDTAPSFFKKFVLEEPTFTEEAILPGGIQIDLRPDDQGVYIGRIRYHRGAFFEITKVEVIDDYARVREEFAARFGSGVRLRKALVGAE